LDWMHERRLLRRVRETVTCGVESPGSLGYIAKRWRFCVYGSTHFTNHCICLLWKHFQYTALSSPSTTRRTDTGLATMYVGNGDDTDTLRSSPYASQFALEGGPPGAHTVPVRATDEEVGLRKPYHDWSMPLSTSLGHQSSRLGKQLQAEPRQAFSSTLRDST